MLADEPTANVDPNNQQQTIDLIREQCREEEIAMIIVTHSMEVANQFNRVDRLEEMNLVVSEARKRAGQQNNTARIATAAESDGGTP